MTKLPRKPVGRALADEDGLDDEALDQVVGGGGGPMTKQDEHDGWSRMVDDHAKEIPAAPATKPDRAGPRSDDA